jgi:hypothetical protein
MARGLGKEVMMEVLVAVLMRKGSSRLFALNKTSNNAQPLHIHPEDDNCNDCRSVGQFSTTMCEAEDAYWSCSVLRSK